MSRVHALVLAAIVSWTWACESGDSGKDTSTGPDVAADTGGGQDLPATDLPATDLGTPDTPPVMGTFQATLIDFQSKDPVEGALVKVLDNATGLPTGQEVRSKANGLVELQLPKGIRVGFLASGADAKPTYQFNIDSEAQDETLWLVSELTYNVAPALAGLTVDPTKGIVAGGLYFFNDKNQDGRIDEGEEEKVGCGTIETTPAGEYRYFNPTTGLPASLEAAPTTSKNLSYFLAGNVAIDQSGKVTVTAKVGTTVVGTVDIFVQPDSICISNIYADTPANPTPGDCTR